ncbi:MAG: hypothetical protein JNM10_08140, partial [Planctomycetia bacterium]|nr:hypothetical protein [Planctomycetia bacterium]
MDAPIAPPAPDADGDARAPGTARPGRPQLGGWPLGRRRPAGDAVREPAPAWTIVFGLGLLVVAGIVGWRAWHAPRPPEPFPLRVVDEAGRPVEGAMVALAASPDARGPVERSDADGRLVFGGRRLDRDRKRGADDGPAFATLLPVVPSFGAARVGRRWYRIDPDVPVRRGDVLRLAPVAVATLEARLDTEDGPVVLVDFRRSADDLNAPTIPGDDDGVVRVPVVGADVRGVLVTPDLTNTCASEPLVLGPASEHSRRVVVRADAPLVRLALETADGAPR